MSFHGVPERTRELGDPYFGECMTTATLLAQALGLQQDQYKVTFQSRLGRAKWLQPYTEPTLVALAQSGVQRVDVICPGFNCDGLETLEEIDQEGREAFMAAGGKTFHYIPCLNDSEAWIGARDRAVLLLLYGAGLRIAEALSLTGAMLPLGEVLTVTGKGGKQRVVPLLPIVLGAAVASHLTGGLVTGL